MKLTTAFKILRSPEPPPCDCENGAAMCARPCWPTPAEAKKLIRLGHGARLALRRYCAYEGNIEVIAPSGFMPSILGIGSPGRCTFHTDDKKCELHGIAKPVEGRLCHHDKVLDPHEAVVRTWDTEEGRALVAHWKKTTPDYVTED